mgnify:CR=1 FL=1
MEKKVLSGIRVLDLTTFIAAPQCGRMLASLGADVIKVEAPEKDFYRIEAPLFEVGIPCTDDENPIFLNANAGKRMIVLDLKKQSGLEVLLKLAARSDILITNMRTAALEKLGIGYERIHALNPRLVYGHLNGYGQEGPEAAKPGFDSQAYLARGGFLLDTTEPGCTPNEMVLGSGDSATGLALFCGVLAAFAGAQRTGQGRFVNSSLLNAAIWAGMMHLTLQQYGLPTGCSRKEPVAFALINEYRCRDGEWVSLNASQHLLNDWKELCTALGAPEAAADSRFCTLAGQRKNRAAAVALLDRLFAQKTYAEWDKILSGTNVAYEHVVRLLDVVKDPQANANGYFLRRFYSSGKVLSVATPPFQMEGMGEDLTKTLHFGEHTQEVLRELGYSGGEIRRLYECKAVM